MRVHVEVGGYLVEHLPGGEGEQVLELPDGTTALDVMKRIGLPLEESYLVVLNDSVLTSADRATRALAEGDRLSLMPPLRGG